MRNNYICALDIGSSKISASLAEIKRKHLSGIYFDTLPVKGVKKGAIVDSIDLTNSIGRIMKNLKNRSGINIKFVYANISGLDIVTKHSRAIIPLAERGNKVITESDIRKVNEQARILGSSLEEEIIHQIPSGYAIDSKNNIPNPLGLYSHRLEVDLYLVCGKLSSMQSLNRAIDQAGYEIKGLFFSGIATSEIVLNAELKKGFNILCDIGSDITELVVFHDGVPREIRILSVGGDDLTVYLANELRIPLDLAEDVKRSHGSVGDSGHIREEKEILVKKNNLYKPIKQKLVCEIMTSKANSLCQTIKEAIDKAGISSNVNNFVATGRTVLLEGFLEVLENNLGFPVKFGRITHPDMVFFANNDLGLSGQKYLNYLTSLGIICQALRKERPLVLSDAHPAPNIFSRTLNKAIDVYREYF